MTTWNETAEKFAHVTDTRGKKIDPGIFETVVALNTLGITTTQSCEGHLEWGLPYPWVNFPVNEELKFQLYGYLAQFYKDRHVDFDTVLGFHGYRIQSHGAVVAMFLPDEERKARLKMYQSEMLAFTQFLKDKEISTRRQ